jgi:predicted transcriptional regulator
METYTVKEIAGRLECDIIGGEQGLEKKVSGAYAADLLSDVMGRAREGQLWITMQAHKNVMAIASLRELSGVILVNGNRPDQDMLAQANEEGIPVLGTSKGAFETAGQLYQILHTK